MKTFCVIRLDLNIKTRLIQIEIMKKLIAAIVLSVIAFVNVNAQSVAFKVGYTHSDVIVSPEPVNIFTPKETFHAGIAIKDLK